MKSSDTRANIVNGAKRLTVFVFGSAILSVALLVPSGCKQSAAPTATVTSRTDQQIAADIQAKISAESALAGQSVQVEVQSGVATLNGAVGDNASRALAGNDAGTVDGVKTVVNNLSVQPPSSASATAPRSFPAPAVQPYTDRRTRENTRRDRYSDSRNTARNQDRGSQDQNATNRGQAPQGNAYPAPPPNYQQSQAQAPQAPPSPPRPSAINVTVPEGTVLPVRISEALDSSQAQSDDVFHGTLAQDLVIDGMVAMSRGASVMGRVVNARDAAHFKGSSLLSLELTQVTSRGRQIPIVTEAYTKEGQARGRNTAEKAGGGAALGAIIGAIAGGGKGAAIGAAAGGGIGAGANGVTRGQQVQIPSEAIVSFRLRSPVNVITSRRAGAPRSEEQDTPHPTLEQR